MADLGDIATSVRDLDIDAFCRKHPYGFLLERLESDDDPEWAFKTTTVSRPTGVQRPRLSAEARRHRVRSLVKATGNAWRERISVGRARNNDIVLSDNSVSKLHAYFVVEDGAGAQLVDAGSRNGTSVNGRPVAPNEPVAIAPGDEVSFGTVAVTFLDNRGVYRFLHKELE